MVCVPPPKEKVGGRSQGPCAALLATIAAIAPAAPAFATFMLTAQRPRSISRIFPRNGVPVHGLAPAALVPADDTTTTPRLTALALAALRSSSFCPYDEPSDMLMTSTASEMLPSPLGSRANSIPCRRATPLQLVETALHTLTA